MKKKLTLFLSLLCVAAMLFPTAVSALPPSDYAPEAEALRNDAFVTYKPTYTGAAFDGYSGPYTVDTFPLSDPKSLTTFHQFVEKYKILCKTINAAGDDGDQWTYGGIYLSNLRLALVQNHAVSITYHVPRNGIVDLSLAELAASADGDATFGAKFAIFKNGVRIWPTTSNKGDANGFYVFEDTKVSTSGTRASFLNAAMAYEAFPTDLAVQQGDTISFAMTKGLTYMGYAEPCVTYTNYSGETYSMAERFNGLQSSGGFYAGYSAKGSEAVYSLPRYDSVSGAFCGKNGVGTVSANGLTIENGGDTVILFRSPLIATYTLTAPAFSTTSTVAFSAKIYRADGTTEQIASQPYPASATVFTPVTGIALDRGDVVAMRFSAEEAASVTFSPVLSSTNTVHATSRNGEALTQLVGGFSLKPDILLDAIAASLGGSINLHLYAYFSPELLARAEEYGMLIFPVEQESYEYDEAYAYTAAETYGNNEYVYTYQDIAAKEMTDEIYARPYCKTESGMVYGEVRSASVRSYAETLKGQYAGSTTAQGEALYKLACAMLNYGAEAQTYFNYKTDDLANAGLTNEEKQTPVGEYENKIGLTGEATLSGYQYYGASLVLEDLPALRIFLTVEDGLSMENIRIEMAYDEAFTNPKSYTPAWHSSVGAYGITVVGVPVALMRTMHYFRITDGTSTSYTLSYSPETYAARSHANNLDSRDVADALFTYVDAALHFANVSGQAQEGISISAAALVDAIRNGTVTQNAVYRINDASSLLFNSVDDGADYDAKNITVYTEQPLLISGAIDLRLSNLHLISTNRSITAIEATHATASVLENVTVGGAAAIGVQVKNTDGFFLRGTDVTGDIETGVIISESAANVYLTDAIIEAGKLAIRDAGRVGAYIKDNTITSAETGVSLSTTGSELRDNTITAPGCAVYATGAIDTLVARNTVTGAILCEDSDNIVFLKNSATTLTAGHNENLYVVSNLLSGRLTLEGNNYLLADLNTEEAVTDTNNENKNGDDVTDVNARLAVGANEEILPHVDRDQFLHHERKNTLRRQDGSHVSFIDYVDAALAEESDVILAPGVYTITGQHQLKNQSNKNIYAFGAMLEQQEYLKQIFYLNGCSNLTMHGLTLGFAQQSCGQVYVLDKLANNTLLAVTGAGMMNEFGNTNANYYNVTAMGAQRAGTFYAYCDTWFESITKNANGTMNISLTADVYNMIREGDILTCRSENSGRTVAVYNSGDVAFRDMTVYGNSGGFAFVEEKNETATTYYRVANTTKSGPIISKEVYDRYKSLESTYGVDLELAIDADGNYRGAPPHIGSVDATHTTGCKEGSQAISCLFENMCDDGTNQNHTPGRLHRVVDNGDTTTTIYYKGVLSRQSYSNNNRKPETLCRDFQVGDRVYIYTSAGQLLCDTKALSATVDHGKFVNSEYGTETPLRSVTVLTASLNTEPLADFNLESNTQEDKDKVMIDNMSMASDHFLFDNVLVRNIRSRGLLIKSSNATIQSCTMENIGMAAIAIHYELDWAESGVCENLTVKNNKIVNTGYFTPNEVLRSPISVLGLTTTKADDDYLLYKNISITGNHIIDRATKNAIYINTAKDVTITGNVIGAPKGATEATDITPYVFICCAKNVELSDNVYPDYVTSYSHRLMLKNAINVYGNDIPALITDKMTDSGNLSIVYSANSVTYPGSWTFGSLPVEAPCLEDGSSTFKPFTHYDPNDWITDDSITIWGGRGGIRTSTRGYRMAAQANYHCAIRYTVPQCTHISIALENLLVPQAEGANGAANGYIAIFHNGEMIWPTAGGSYTDGSDWQLITTTSSVEEIKSSIAGQLRHLAVMTGDEILFVSRYISGWSNLAIHPSVSIINEKASSFELDNENWPSYTPPTATGASFNGSFDGFNGHWTMGYLPLAGGTYTKYGAMFNNLQSILMTNGDADAWTHGGMYMPTGRLALVANYATTITYHAPKNGNIDVSFLRLSSGADKATVYGAKLAIFKNGVKIWPTTSNAGDANGYYVYSSGSSYAASLEFSFLEAAAAYEAFPTNLSVQAGDMIQFAMARGSSNMGYCEPCIAYR
ncbi:MAG: right-handed parallel beta-helix repeat-containing protein [Clostridia bacterium]|nr:right-handed parallel beta-helix repeat-containing protein [Clostridia bacterium]